MLITPLSIVTAKNGTKLPIIMYHHFAKNEKMLGKYTISPNQFEKDLIYLKANGYTSVTAKQLTDYSKGKGTLPKKACMITFDDGFESVYAYCLPLLKKYDMKAIMFIESSLADTYTDINDHNLTYSYINWEYLSEALKSGYLEIGCHSHNMHKIYPRMGITQNSGEDLETYRRILTEDTQLFKAKIKENLELETTLYAIPFGAYTDNTIEILNELGYNAVFTCTECVNTVIFNQKLPLLGRFNRPSGISSEKFFKQWE